LHRRCLLVLLTPFLWPALAAAAASEMVSAFAKELAHLAAGPPSNSMFREPRWTTPNRIALELPSMRLREFSADGDGIATLVCAPLALHDATLTDFAPGHSLVAALRMAGLRNVFVTDWRSASPEMRFFSIDSYLADLNVVVDELGGCANLVGVCQGGWMALVYAARYPSKIHGLVLAGAPVDINAGESELSRVAHNVPTSVFKHLVELGDGRVRGSHLLQLWKHPPLEPEAIHDLLQVPDDIATPRSSGLITLFHEWCARPIDLPGTYYLQVVQWLYKDNQLATGRFAALGRPIDLSMVRRPIFLLAARDDEIVAPEQLLAARHLVGSNSHQIRTEIVPCTHLGLFMGATTLQHTWPKIARWLVAS
jgi:poly(3-hydroxybutyrate) depolymerase